MAVETLISVEEYLRTSYSPDMEYVDGTLVELNVGDPLHSLVQSNIIFALRSKYKHMRVLPELRSRVSATRYRLPDVCVTLKLPDSRALLEPPFVAIEILSEDDRTGRILEKLGEYKAIGTPHIWVIEPRQKLLFTFNGSLIEADSLCTSDPRLELTREEIFQE